MTDRNTPLLVTILIILIAAIAAGAWFLMKDEDVPGDTTNTVNTVNTPNTQFNSTTTTTTTTSVEPQPAAAAAVRARAASDLKVNQSAVTVVSVFARDWSDGCLGLGGAAESCIQAITPITAFTSGSSSPSFVTDTNGRLSFDTRT